MSVPLSKLTSRTLGGVLDEVALAEGSRPAVFYGGTVISYRDLQAHTREAARSLLALGVRRGDRVSVLLGNQPEWLVMCFAAASVGATFVPLNTWYKSTELAWTLRHCGISVLVFAPQFLNQNFAAMLHALIPEMATSGASGLRSAEFPKLRHLVSLDRPAHGAIPWSDFLSLSASVSPQELDDAGRAVTADDTLFILYTSGSLAEPKGVTLSHRGVIENAFGMGHRRAIERDDRIWLGSPLFYGLGATNALPIALTHGASLVLQGSFDPATAIRTIAETQATAWYGTGNMSRAILDHADYAQSKIGSLKKGNAGTMAEYKRMTLVEMGISQACPAYGLTESYGNATVGMFDDPLEAKLQTNGRPLPGTEMLIVDPTTNEPLPAGQTGLVLLRGYTTPGYYANPEETRRALRPDGFFDTGDLGFLDDEGRFVFQARLKEVIKSGGINVSPMEVEQILVQHPHIIDAHVVGVADPVKGELIAAFVCTNATVTTAEIRDYVKERAASFKVPHHVFMRTETQLPRLASGKIAKYRLVEEASRELGL